MAVTKFKTWVAGEVLTASDLNASFDQVFDNGEDLGWPATKAKDLDGFKLILDSDADTSITADTDDHIDFEVGGTDTIELTTTELRPSSDDGAGLGTSSLGWSDLFLASGAVINFNGGDITLTHSANTLTFSGGTLSASALSVTDFDNLTLQDEGALRTSTTNGDIAYIQAYDISLGGSYTTFGTLTAGSSPSFELDNTILDTAVAKGTWTASGTWTIPAVTLGGTITWNGQSASGTLADGGTVTTIDINGGTIDGTTIGGSSAAAIAGTTITANTGLVPDADDGAYIGQSGTAFSDLFLASGAVIDFNASDVTLTHSANTLTLGGGNLAAGTGTITTAALLANSDDSGALGASGTGFSDLFLASGAVINFNAGDVTLTHSANALTLGGGNLALGANTLTASGGGSLTGTWSDLGTVTTIDINGGTVDGVTIGGASAGAGTFTTLTATTLDFGNEDLTAFRDAQSWTPTLTTDGTDFDSVTYDAVTEGVYWRINDLIYFVFRVRTDAVTVGSASGNTRIGGLPATAIAGSIVGGVTITRSVNFAGNHPMQGRIVGGTTAIELSYWTAGSGTALIDPTADIGTGTNDNDVWGFGFYRAA